MKSQTKSVQLALAQLDNMSQENLKIENLVLDEVNAILVALQELPGKICNPLSDKIRQQVMGQLEAIKQNEDGGRTISKSIDEDIATQDKLGA